MFGLENNGNLAEAMSVLVQKCRTCSDCQTLYEIQEAAFQISGHYKRVLDVIFKEDPKFKVKFMKRWESTIPSQWDKSRDRSRDQSNITYKARGEGGAKEIHPKVWLLSQLDLTDLPMCQAALGNNL